MSLVESPIDSGVSTSQAATAPTDSVALLDPVTLEELDAAAALLERIDRKYVVEAEQLSSLVDALSDRHRVLEIDGRRTAAYQSVYFDTDDLESYLAAARRRRRRFKVRTRTYVDTRTTMLEVKTRGARRQTIKQRHEHDFDRREELGGVGRGFVDRATGVDDLGARLVATLTTEYHRTTLADLDAGTRLTIDAGLRCIDRTARSVELRDRFIVETKSTGAPSVADRWLWSAGLRPEKISKFGTGLAALRPDLPSNKWHRTLVRHF